jgi:hypothetical protein
MSKQTPIRNINQCLSRQEICDYIEHKLDRETTYAIEEHFSECMLCADAIEGLMSVPTENRETLMTPSLELWHDIKPSAVEPKAKEQSIPLSSTRGGGQSLMNRYPWAVAASILFAVALGGWSVFSLMHRPDHVLSKNENKTAVQEAPVSYQKSAAGPDEITTLSTPLPEAKKAIPVTQVKPIATSSPRDITKTEDEQIDEVPPVASPLTEQAAAPEAKQAMAAAPAQEDKEEVTSVASKDLDKKGIAREDVVRAGMSQNNTEFNNANSRVLSYSSALTKNNTNALSKYVPKKSSTAYAEGIQFYQQKDYQKAISHLEEALDMANDQTIEDIQFYLAKSYQAVGKERQARKLFVKLSKGKKYQIEAERELSVLTK